MSRKIKRPAWGGLDLSAVEDITSLALVERTPDDKTRLYVRGWIPEDALLKRLKKRDMQLQKFVESGHLIMTKGGTVDYEYIKHDVRLAMNHFDIQAIAFDRWNSTQCVNDLLQEGVPMVEFGQGYGSMSAPMKELMRLVLDKNIEFSNPLLQWAMGNVVSDQNPAGDVKPAKDKVKEKIDPVVASIMAIGMYMKNPVKKRVSSIYASGEL